MTSPSRVARAAIRIPSSTLAKHISATYELADCSCRIEVLHSRDLDQSQRDSIWDIFKGNMYEFYKNSSFGWDPEAKTKELYHPLSRFILVYSQDANDIVAFTMFRFEEEEDEDVIYCYDIQVGSSAQRMGLGRRLLNELGNLCQALGIPKVMLTVFKANIKALAFYRSVGFVIDPTSPDYVDSDDEFDADLEEEEADYEILSKIMVIA